MSENGYGLIILGQAMIIFGLVLMLLGLTIKSIWKCTVTKN